MAKKAIVIAGSACGGSMNIAIGRACRRHQTDQGNGQETVLKVLEGLRLGRLACIFSGVESHTTAQGLAMSHRATLTLKTFEESVRRMTPVTAPQDQRENLAALRELFEHVTSERTDSAAYKLMSPSGEVTPLPESVLLLLEHITEVFARGDAITVVPVGKELTTQQSADILNVSRQYLVRLLEDGHIPSHKTGTHRRVQMEDLLAYKRQRDRDRMASLEDLSQLSQDFGGYDELPKGT